MPHNIRAQVLLTLILNKICSCLRRQSKLASIQCPALWIHQTTISIVALSLMIQTLQGIKTVLVKLTTWIITNSLTRSSLYDPAKPNNNEEHKCTRGRSRTDRRTWIRSRMDKRTWIRSFRINSNGSTTSQCRTPLQAPSRMNRCQGIILTVKYLTACKIA